MTAKNSLVSAVLAAWNGASAGMQALEAALTQAPQADPMAELEHLQRVVAHDLAALPMLHAARAAFRPSGLAKLAEQLGWIISTLRSWDRTHDPDGRRLTAALIAASAWNVCLDLWSELHVHVANWAEVARGCANLILMRSDTASLPNSAPIWQKELLVSFHDAEQRQDWAALSKLTVSFPPVSFDPAAEEAVRALWEADRPLLIRLTDKTDGWFRAVRIVRSLSFPDAMALAAASSSGQVHLAALEGAKREGGARLSKTAEDAIEELLVKLARDPEAWPSWLAMFNRWPGRHPGLQKPLGRALALSSEAAALAYIESIELNFSGPGRTSVGACLSAFAAAGSESLRLRMWRFTHERWRRWQFAQDDGRELADVARSDIDFGVVGWFVECTEPMDLAAEIDAFPDRLRAIENDWHPSASALRGAVYRLLSAYRLQAHAACSGKDGSDWLASDAIHTPVALNDAYLRSRHSLL